MLQEFETYLLETQKISKSNREQCMRVMKKLTEGKGIKHKNKPDEFFCKGRCISLGDDLEQLKREANAWLPHQKADPACLDHGHGWALNHPIARFIDFKNWKMRLVTRTAGAAGAARETRDVTAESDTSSSPSAEVVHELDSDSDSDEEEDAGEKGENDRTNHTNAHINTRSTPPASSTTQTTHTTHNAHNAHMALVVGAASSGADRSDEMVAVGEAVSAMDIDVYDDDFMAGEDAGGGRLTLYGDGADVPYNPPMATEFERLARTCYMNLTLCKYLKRKNMHNSAHSQMKKAIRDFYVANPSHLEPTGLTVGTFSVDHVIPENLGGLNHVANFHLMPPGVNSHFRDTWTAAKLRYVGHYAAKGALSLHKFFHRDQYTYDFSKFNPLHSF